MEECSELIKAVSEYMRLANESAQPIRNLAEEIADVEIMIEQFKTILSFEELEKRVNTAKHDKLLKLKNILEPFPTSNNKGETK
jgi:NTP pyrophosphatase (non-canonical NTP hydrolase)